MARRDLPSLRAGNHSLLFVTVVLCKRFLSPRAQQTQGAQQSAVCCTLSRPRLCSPGVAARASPSVPILTGRCVAQHSPAAWDSSSTACSGRTVTVCPAVLLHIKREEKSSRLGNRCLVRGQRGPGDTEVERERGTWCCAAWLGDSDRLHASWLWLHSRHVGLNSALRQQLFQMGKHLCTSPACRGVTWQRWAAYRSSWPRLQHSP